MKKTPEPYHSPLLDEILARITPQEQEKVAIKMRVAANIADLLEERDMQKKQLAELCDLKGSSMVTKWLYGAHNFTLDTLVDIAFALGVNVADLVQPIEQQVFFTQTLFIQAPAASPKKKAIKMSDTTFVGRSSNAIGSVAGVSEPLFQYGPHQPCYA